VELSSFLIMKTDDNSTLNEGVLRLGKWEHEKGGGVR